MGILISLYSVVKELDKFFLGGGFFGGIAKKKREMMWEWWGFCIFVD